MKRQTAPRNLLHRSLGRLGLQSYLVFPLPKGLLGSRCVLINDSLGDFPRRKGIVDVSAPGGARAAPRECSCWWFITERRFEAAGAPRVLSPCTPSVPPRPTQQTLQGAVGDTGQERGLGAWLCHMGVLTTVLRRGFVQ